MNNLSIVIRDKEDKIYEHLEKLKPLLEDNKTQLVLVNNEIEKFNIPYEYTHYEFQESYHKFSDFYESICLYDNKLLIEKGIQLNSEFIKSMKQSIENNKNFKVKIRKFINDNKTEYLVSDLILVTNDNSNEMELLDYFILEDYSMIAFNLEDIEVNLYNLLKSKSYEGIFKWYKACIRSKGKVYEQKFFEALECLKFILEVKEDEINKLFLSNEVNDRYKNYLTIMSLYQEKKDGFIKKIKSLLSIDSFQEEDIYFSNFIRKLFNDKKHCMEVLSCINTAYLNCCIRYILDKNETFYIDIYNFTVSIDLEKETSIKNNDRIPLILNILKSYISYMGDKSADIKKKNILIQMFLDYTNYGFYNLNKNIDINRDLSLNDETKFLIEMDKVADCLNKNLINEAISILRNAAEEYTPMTMAVRYYIQKLIRDNNIYKYKLSICMMAKNEEKFLNKCLNSIKPLLDCGMAELIFVDTGSTDSTAKIASNYVNKIYHKLWEGNFSKMRNYCISLAQGEYIFILDADEELEEGETEKLIKLFNSEEYTKYNTYTFKEKNFNDEEYKDFSMLIRNAIFKNREDFCYYGSVHNQPNKIGPINDLDIILLHYGYIMTEDIKDKKFIRTATLLKKELQKEPRDVYYRYQLSVSYSMHGDHKKALEQVNVYMKLLEDKKLTKGLSLMAYNNAAIIYHLNGLYEKVIEVCNRALEIEPTFIDFVYNKALAQFASEQYSEAINNYLQYLDLITNIEKITILNDDRYIFYSLGSKNEALGKLLICYYKINDCDNFNRVIDKINDDTLLKYSVYTALKFYIKNKRYDYLKQFFMKKVMSNDNYDVKYVFSYFISEIIDECEEEEKQNIIKLFNSINESNEYLETIKSLISSQGNSLAILDFINKCDLDKLDLVTAKMVLDKTYALVTKDDVISKLTLEEIKALKNGVLFILNNTINYKLFKGLTKENLLVIINNYFKLCNVLISKERYDLLNEKEIDFLKIIKSAEEDFNKNNLTQGLRKVKDAVSIHKEMARAMQLYLETIIPGYDADLDYFNNSNGEQGMNNELIEYSKKIKAQIEQLINNNSLEEAELLIKQYKEIINNDAEVYSMEAIVYMLKGNIDKAKSTLLDGLNFDEENFDLNYNLAYICLMENKFTDSIRYYKLAQKNCMNKELVNEINETVTKIMKENNIAFDKNNKEDYEIIEIKKILFIQSIPDIRTNKIAKILNLKGIQVDIMYLEMHPSQVYKELQLPYKNIFKIENINDTIKFINNSDYDILFSSNEPDYLTALLSITNKPIVHDCHDMMSLRGQIANEQIILEYLANTKCDGNIYVTELVKKVAKSRFGLNNKPIMVLDNYILKSQLPKKFLQKMSEMDGEIHCVYEGGLSNFDGHHRNIEDIFIKLAENRIHVHYYAPFENEHYRELSRKSKYLHFEGTKEPNELIEDMTKYDIGLVVLNVTERNKTFLDTTFPNKAWEYLAAGLPLLFSDLISFREFLNKYRVGEIINLESGLIDQVYRVKNLKLDGNFLINNNLTMDNFFVSLINFLAKVKENYYKNSNKVVTEDKNSTKPKIIMTGSYGSGNIGDELISFSIKNSKVGTNIDKVMCFNEDICKMYLKDTELIQQNDFESAKLQIYNSNGLLFGGGGLFYDYGDINQTNIRYRLLLAAYAIKNNKPIYILNVGTNGILLKLNQDLVRNIFDYADFISVRDKKSLEELKGLGIRNKINLGVDNVYSILPSVEQIANNVSKEKIIGLEIRPIMRLVYAEGEKDEQVYKKIAQVCDNFIEDEGYKVRFFSTYIPYDREAFERIVNYSQNKREFEIVETFKINDIFINLAKCRCFIGMSLHTLIFASMLNTKFIGIGYHPKIKSFCEEMNAIKYYVDYPEFSADSLQTIIKEILMEDIDYNKKVKQFYSVCEETYEELNRAIANPSKFKNFQIENDNMRKFLMENGLI